MEFSPYGHKEKGIYYKVIDEFTLFYLRWMEPNLSSITRQDSSDGYWLAKSCSAGWRSWSGLAFEAVCFKHVTQIRQALGIQAGANVGSWRYVPRKPGSEGAQIDLLFDRDDGAVTICEIKCRQESYTLNKEDAYKLIDRAKTFQHKRRLAKQIFLALIVAPDLKQSVYSEEFLSGVVILSDLFKDVNR